MNRRRAMPLLGAMPLVLSGCSTFDYSLRFRFEIEVDVGNDLIRGHNVVDLSVSADSYTKHLHTKNHGEALYLDMGGSRPPLVALLTYHSGAATFAYGYSALFIAYSIAYDLSFEQMRHRGFEELQKRRGKRKLSVSSPKDGELPDFVTFDDPSRPITVRRVNPTRLRDDFGADVTLRSASIEVVEPDGWFAFGRGIPRTSGIERQLPWLDDYYDKMLDGKKPGSPGSRREPARRLNTDSFRAK